MIRDKRMTFIKTIDNYDLYLFSPTIFRLYYEKRTDDAPHRYVLTHKIHMLLYLLRGGYKILYLSDKNGYILSYIVYKKRADLVFDRANKNDCFIIFLWTYPKYRNIGLSTKISNYLLRDENCAFYKVISPINAPSIKVAEKCGFAFAGQCKKNKRKKIFLDGQGDWLLFKYNKRKDKQ